jgi:hypothetical protein
MTCSALAWLAVGLGLAIAALGGAALVVGLAAISRAERAHHDAQWRHARTTRDTGDAT